ncbi:uncharacterized protein DMENIID0001_039830 [Sergentomyia squamirostris]
MCSLNLIDLDDDCLLHIVSFLELPDLLNFERVCCRTQEIARIVYKKFSNFHLRLREAFGQSEKILSSIGEFIEFLQFSLGFGINKDIKMGILEDISKFCPNMHTIKLQYFSLNTEERVTHLEPLSKCKSLRTIIFQACDTPRENLRNYDKLKHLKFVFERI